ncbi:hypothetical protein J2S55_008069 [Streptosporangium brasiliense]|uniref:Uncharacterized protein n=1 Tax=Streptosporangium brasiliense TaxID=47480 RepID=A0ABT9RHP3_9ACTN|nr:hypothetical protein [Streptosporangium brasiliense]
MHFRALVPGERASELGGENRDGLYERVTNLGGPPIVTEIPVLRAGAGTGTEAPMTS